jgi:septal ring factor EnvC (AmiA/AmiB activator)
MQGKKGQSEIKELEKRKVRIKKQLSDAKKQGKALSKELKTWRAKIEDSKNKLQREKTEYDFVVGTSLEYAKKNKLLMAIWEGIDEVRSVALKSVTVKQNSVALEMLSPSDVYLTEFMGELNKRKDLIDTIRIVETKIEKLDKKSTKELLFGRLDIVAKRPRVNKKKAGGEEEETEETVQETPAETGKKPAEEEKTSSASKGKKKKKRKKKK